MSNSKVFLKKLYSNKYKNSYISILQYQKRNKKKKEIIELKNCNYYKKSHLQKINNFKNYLKKKNFIKFYYKFNANLKLWNEYDCKLKPKKTKEACLETYLELSSLTFANKVLNIAQKLNTILKLNDKIIIQFIKKKHFFLINKIKKSFKNEDILINKLVNG